MTHILVYVWLVFDHRTALYYSVYVKVKVGRKDAAGGGVH
jgi:hypothetical protein